MTSEKAHSRIGLQLHKTLIAIHFERCLKSIPHLPHENDADLNRIAYFIVDFDLIAVKVSRTERKRFLHEKRIYPMETIALYRAPIVAEQNQHDGAVGVNKEKSRHKHNRKR